MREYSKELRDLVASGSSESAITSVIENRMEEVYRIVSICLGVPPEQFTWEYYDKQKQYTHVGPITPLEFYQTLVKPVYNVDDKVNY